MHKRDNGRKIFENYERDNTPEVEHKVENTNVTLKRNATHISLISGQGFTVVMCVHSVHVNVSQRHWNTTCGLCGNNDGLKEWEFRTPFTQQPTHVTNDTKFGISWVVQGDDCQDPECKLKKFVSFPLSRIESEEVMIGESKAACFSNEPVFYCPEDCTPVPMRDVFLNSNYEPKKKAVKIGFSCIKTSDPATAYQRVGGQTFTNKPADIFREVEVPQKCNCRQTCINASRRW
ncbi:vitellogenin-like [Amphiura filiformis]|uniref:vitellogenin-like n=1 Tax=Amphiura filiformis TaxID=82378 RepID=UPI003B20BBCB